MKYALPCAGTLVKRGSVSQETIDRLILAVKTGKEIPKDAERIFKVAFSACSLSAIDSGKENIDEKVIRQYYLFGHDKMIDQRYEEMGDFSPDACRIRAGIVQSVRDGFAVVANSAGAAKYRTDYCPVKEGDLVTTHWDFVVEKIDPETARRMKTQKVELKIK